MSLVSLGIPEGIIYWIFFLFLKLLYVKQLKNYYLYKTDQGKCLPHLFLMECNASRKLDKKLKLSPRNSISHAFTPSEFYNRFLHT